MEGLNLKSAFEAPCIGASDADLLPSFPDGTIFKNQNASKELWCVVDDGKLLTFGGDKAKGKEAIYILNRLAKPARTWHRSTDVVVIFPDGHQNIFPNLKNHTRNES